MTNGTPALIHVCEESGECMRVKVRFTPLLYGNIVEIPTRYLDEFCESLYTAEDDLLEALGHDE